MTATIFHNIARLVTPVDRGKPLSGTDQGAVRDIPGAAILVRDGVIRAVGREGDVLAQANGGDARVDCGGTLVVPGFVDPHTHMCFAVRREAEFRMRLVGATYLEILDQGGGILSSVTAVRRATDEELLKTTVTLAARALRHGTTTLEIKSGYGLDTETELRMLRVIAAVESVTGQAVVPTFMGAHAVPPEYKERPDDFVDLLVNEMLPAVADQDFARFCDVFCEQGVFSPAQSRRILEAAAKRGLGLKIHADEVNDLGGAALAGEVRATSAEHLLAASDTGLSRMAEAGTLAVLLPGTAYSLRKPYARALDMIGLDLPLALATDCNPGSCFCESMPFVIGLAVLNMGLSPEQALVAATLNAAYAIGEQRRAGSLEPGKDADFILLDGDSPAILAYHAGVNPVTTVYRRGQLAADNAATHDEETPC